MDLSMLEPNFKAKPFQFPLWFDLGGNYCIKQDQQLSLLTLVILPLH